MLLDAACPDALGARICRFLGREIGLLLVEDRVGVVGPGGLREAKLVWQIGRVGIRKIDDAVGAWRVGGGLTEGRRRLRRPGEDRTDLQPEVADRRPTRYGERPISLFDLTVRPETERLVDERTACREANRGAADLGFDPVHGYPDRWSVRAQRDRVLEADDAVQLG